MKGLYGNLSSFNNPNMFGPEFGGRTVAEEKFIAEVQSKAPHVLANLVEVTGKSIIKALKVNPNIAKELYLAGVTLPDMKEKTFTQDSPNMMSAIIQDSTNGVSTIATSARSQLRNAMSGTTAIITDKRLKGGVQNSHEIPFAVGEDFAVIGANPANVHQVAGHA